MSDHTGEMVEVEVTATQKQRFAQRHKIPLSLFKKYEEMCERNARDSEFEGVFGHLIDPADPYDWDDMDDIEIERCGVSLHHHTEGK